MAKLSDMIPSKYLKGADFPEPKVLTIKDLTNETVSQAGEPVQTKWALWFNELSKPLLLNKTNLERLGGYGNDSDAWIGKKVKVYFDAEVQHLGKTVGGLRVSLPKAAPAKPATPPPPADDADFDDDIPF